MVILPYRSPIPVAKLLASVDVLSGGRLIVGAAIGWLEGEFDALGVPFKERVSRSEESLELMRALWTQERPKIETSRHRAAGRLVLADDAAEAPTSALRRRGQQGALRRVARLGDGWHATADEPDAFRQGVDDGPPLLERSRTRGRARSLAAHPDPDRGRPRAAVEWRSSAAVTCRGASQKMSMSWAGFKAVGCEHVALEVSYSTYPAIHETIDSSPSGCVPRWRDDL